MSVSMRERRESSARTAPTTAQLRSRHLVEVAVLFVEEHQNELFRQTEAMRCRICCCETHCSRRSRAFQNPILFSLPQLSQCTYQTVKQSQGIYVHLHQPPSSPLFLSRESGDSLTIANQASKPSAPTPHGAFPADIGSVPTRVCRRPQIVICMLRILHGLASLCRTPGNALDSRGRKPGSFSQR